MSAPDFALVGILRALRKARPAAWDPHTFPVNDPPATIAELRALGFVIEEHPAQGFLLSRDSDSLFPENIIAFRAPQHENKAISVFAETSSSQDAAANQMRFTQADPLVLNGAIWVAESQSAGRGRMQRPWHSAAGLGCWFTTFLHKSPLLTPAVVSFAAALSVANALKDICQVSPDLKWPNDLLVGGKKNLRYPYRELSRRRLPCGYRAKCPSTAKQLPRRNPQYSDISRARLAYPAS